jgi:uncharacterized protein (DUF427 family)
MLAGLVIADSGNALRVLETSGPPTIYIPIEDIDMERLEPVDHSSYCEWKGAAHYFDVVVVETRAGKAAWHYPDPKEGFATLEGYVAFYPGRVDACYLGDELVTPQPGGFYGGWITRDIVGPFKGEPGTSGW